MSLHGTSPLAARPAFEPRRPSHSGPTTVIAAVPHRPATASSISSTSRRSHRSTPPTGAAPPLLSHSGGTLEQELAALSEKLAEWKRKRLLEVEEASQAENACSADHAEAAMERRVQQRRQAERTRAQQRMDRLLNTLTTRLSQKELPAATVATFVSDDDIDGTREAVACSSSPPLALASSPPVFLDALVRVEREHYIGQQQIAVEEKAARHAIGMWRVYAVCTAHVVADEAEFRQCLVELEASSFARLLNKATAT